MKRILLLTTVFMMMLGTSFSSAQTDADNFYKSDLVSVEKVSFSNQYKMKVAGNLFLHLKIQHNAVLPLQPLFAFSVPMSMSVLTHYG